MIRKPRARRRRPEITLVHLQGPAEVVSPPLGCLCLLGALERNGIVAEFRDYQLFDGPPFLLEGLVEFMTDDSADILGISAMVNVLPHLVLALRVIREAFPEKTIVLGGPGPVSVAGPLLASYPVADVIVAGEGEEALPVVIRALQAGGNLAAIPGLFLSTPDGPVVTAPRPRIADLDRLTAPAYHLVAMRRYNGALPVESARGCPFACAFCETSAFWGRDVRFFSPERVADIARAAASHTGRHDFGFVDDTFGLDPEREERLLALLEGEELAWTCSTRVERLDEPRVDRMARAGCRGIFLGIESGSDTVLRRINKHGLPVEHIPGRVSLLSGRFDPLTASFVWGFPFEKPEDLADTLSLAAALRRAGAVTPFHLLSALPSAPLTKEFAGLRRFDPHLVPDLSVVPLSAEAVAVIRENVDVFSSFYYFAHPTLHVKRSLVRRHGRPHDCATGDSAIPAEIAGEVS